MIPAITLDFISFNLTAFFHRCRMAILAFIHTNKLSPIIRLKNGTLIDLKSNKIIFETDTTIHCNGNLTLSADKHVMIESGRDYEESREGYVHSIWFNAEKDRQGRPLRYIEAIDSKGNYQIVEYKVIGGEIHVPEGYKLIQ